MHIYTSISIYLYIYIYTLSIYIYIYPHLLLCDRRVERALFRRVERFELSVGGVDHLLPHGHHAVGLIAFHRSLNRETDGCSCAQDGCARQVGQPTQRAANYTARSNIEPAHNFPRQRPKRAPTKRRSLRRQRRRAPHTKHGLGVLVCAGLASTRPPGA